MSGIKSKRTAEMTKCAHFLLEFGRELEGFEEFCFLVLESPILVRRCSFEEVGIPHLY
jgi:hypothetical protein